ncbi:Na+-driven multidrug efflux pump [Salegentibacter holothuriorum]|uniref:Na+-driven multidrug efflux pump n=1 Tax=Salegentibacter holothuriorum TaxID=241145 RepID=A0A1T5CRR0_9FLAO|nr:MATE family efflux transporter [Salegentibacter holothuriorum]SKB62046.1 Na+-driven multidrug efflux pump [Salegentibacter holothuriorum]
MLKKYLIPLFSFFQTFLNKGHERSIKAKKNIITSIGLKGGSIAISLLLVPLTINYVNPERYGIWLTISSIVAWFSFFDIGLTQGLRNKFAIAIAEGDDESAQVYVSTTYAILGIIFTTIWLIFLLINPFLEWSDILNVSEEFSNEISILALIVFTYFCLQFVLRVLTTIITADQEPAKASLIDLIGQGVALLLIVGLVLTTQGSLIYLGLALCIAPILALAGANFFFFSGKYKAYKPSFKKVRFSHAKSLFNLGGIFFVIQVASLVQFESANIIISRNFGPVHVTDYNIVYRYFGILNMGFMIFISPFWSASTEAFLKGDIAWIRNSIKKYNMLNILFIIAGLIMLLFSETIYTLWLGKETVNISFVLSLWGFFYFCSLMFESKYVNFLNGISALRLQFWSSLISPFLFIALVFLFIKHYQMGVYSLFLASIIANFNGLILAPLQYYMIVVKNKRGIWIR